MQGTIGCIHFRYVILNDRRRLIPSALLSQLLPGDIVDYQVVDDALNVTALVTRVATLLYSVVRFVENNHAFLYCHHLPKLFCPILANVDYAPGTVLVLATDNSLDLRVERVSGPIQNADNDVATLLLLYRSLSTITPHYRKGVSHLPDEIVDLTHLDTFTVDPPQSRDFDDAISVESNRLYVHIVDACQIAEGSDEDIEALRKAFTLYLPEHVENALPRQRAEHGLSLIAGERRKVITIEWTLDEAFGIVSTRIVRSIISVKTRYQYSTFPSQFALLVGFTKRYQRSSFAIPSVRYEQDTVVHENHSLAHKIIETAMVMANLAVTEYTGTSIPQRYHARSVVMEPVDTGAPILDAVLTVRKMRTACYESSLSGHHGLDLQSYTHFTSPIRRYFDVIVHRLLSGVEYENLEEVLAHINQRERWVESIGSLSRWLKMARMIEREPRRRGYVIRTIGNGGLVLLEDFLEELFVASLPVELYCVVDITITVVWETMELRGKWS